MAGLELINTTLINDANLLAYYRFEGNSNDYKNFANGTDTNVTYQTSPAEFGQSANYGSTSQSAATISSGLSGSFTILCWARAAAETNGSNIVESHVVSFNNYWCNPIDTSVHFRMQLFDGTNNPFIDSTTTTVANTWYMVAFVRDTSLGKILVYVNNNAANSTTDTTTSVPTYSAFTIGNRTTNVTQDSHYIDDLAVFSRALSATEISNHYNGLDGNFASFKKTNFLRPRIFGPGLAR